VQSGSEGISKDSSTQKADLYQDKHAVFRKELLGVTSWEAGDQVSNGLGASGFQNWIHFSARFCFMVVMELICGKPIFQSEF
jgi:hypothetical protein